MRKSILLLIIAFLKVSTSFSQLNEGPKLVVGIVVDQMCYDYLNRFYDRFGKDGFVKLMEKGVNCRNANYNYVPTYTGPGHASIYTGTTPNNHGIVANEWIDRNSNLLVNCVYDSTVNSIGAESIFGICSPKNLIANTYTDELKLANPNSKIFSISIKDRAAILPGGHLANGAFWYDYASGNMITSSFYMNQLPVWLQEYNAKQIPFKTLQEKTWETIYPLNTYQYPDKSDYEKPLPGKETSEFPYNLKAMCGKDTNYALFTATPFANTYLTDIALEILRNEKLGKDEICDALCISYSTPDIAGHAFGPYSVEIEDMYIKLDLEIARLIKELEKQVGKNNFVLFLTADHAVVPVPKFLQDHNLFGGYVYLTEKMEELNKKVKTKFHQDLNLIEENNNIYIDHNIVKANKLDLIKIEEFIKSEIKTWEGVAQIYLSSELENPLPFEGRNEMVKRGYLAIRSGDLIFTLKPGYLPKGKESETSHKGTSHGSAYSYDTHVPLLFYGMKIKHQEIYEFIEITDIAATITQLLNLQNTNLLIGQPILQLLAK